MQTFNDWRRPYEYDYFDLNEYIDRIELSEAVLIKLNEVEHQFSEYLRKLKEASHFDEDNNGYALIYNWLDDCLTELRESAEVENHNFTFSNNDLISGDLFFERTNMSHDMIKKIHRFVCANSTTNPNILVGEYRKKSVWVGCLDRNGQKDVFWYGVKPEDITKFMKSYVEYYKKRKLLPLYYNPFLKSALAHLLFVRIQPFGDGNRRTARIIHNITFTSEINKFYGTSLKLSPLNISANIKLNQVTYAMRINNVKFSMEEDTNNEINKWFDFILNMYEEQIYFQTNRLKEIGGNLRVLNLLKDEENKINQKASVSKLEKLL